MSNYYITKRELCKGCEGYPNSTYNQCTQCDDGYMETTVDADEWLLEKLKSLRWDDLKGERGYLGPHVSSDGLRFDDSE